MSESYRQVSALLENAVPLIDAGVASGLDREDAFLLFMQAVANAEAGR